MKILVAPCSYKGTISAPDLAAAISQGATEKGHETEVLPFADGGDDTLNCLAGVLGGNFINVQAQGPTGKPVKAKYLSLSGDRAVVELASASGIAHLNIDQLSPLEAHTRGFGETIAAAIKGGARHITLTLGGSASTDGGSGALYSLGARFLDDAGTDIAPGGIGLTNLRVVDFNKLYKNIEGIEFFIASDVSNPLLGVEGAAHIFAPQKGADPAQVELLDGALAHFADIVEAATGRSLRLTPGAGSAGGAGFGLSAVLNAPILSGFEWLAGFLELGARMQKCDAVIVSEGRIDRQSLGGKAVGRIIQLAREMGKKVYALPALVEPGLSAVDLGLDGLAATSRSGQLADLASVKQTTFELLPQTQN